MNSTKPRIDPDTFADRLACGFGRVIPFVRNHDATPFRGDILNACAHHLAFDTQCESSRQVYLYDAIDATGEIDFYVPRVLDLLLSNDTELYISQLYGIACELAKRDHEEAREAVYARLVRDIKAGDLCGADSVIDLDGVEGYLRVARLIVNARSSATVEDFEEYHLLDATIKRDGVRPVRAALTSAGAADPMMARYLENVEVKRQEWLRKLDRREVLSTLGYRQVRAMIDDDSVEPSGMDWRIRKSATQTALRLLAVDLQSESDREKQLKIMHVFRRRDFIGDVAPLLSLVQSSDTDLIRAARRILSKTVEGRIRILGREMVMSGHDVNLGLDLLVASGHEFDYGLLHDVVKRECDNSEFHLRAISIREFIEQHPSVEALPLLVDMYERGRCTMCRAGLLKRMIDCEVTPDWILREAIFDADTSTRATAKAQLRMRRRCN